MDSFDFSASGASLEQALVSVSSNCVFWAFQLSLKGALLRGSSAKHEKEKTGKDNLDRICGVYRMGSKDRWKSALCGDPNARHWDEWDPWRGQKRASLFFSLRGSHCFKRSCNTKHETSARSECFVERNQRTKFFSLFSVSDLSEPCVSLSTLRLE